MPEDSSIAAHRPLQTDARSRDRRGTAGPLLLQADGAACPTNETMNRPIHGKNVRGGALERRIVPSKAG
ncbi:hypothetical protein MPLDJ20_50158 [Mesorhizobium plurifarium]|uniref:Uncharacterized protein n=1 Tax=Mesorhizobium plurifarium TaxID=69974 RepID=A0A090FFD6_MESPL|nr:hypothetical protein MPLDJ20_50158 [Mesorhizobium plurifarium]